MKPKKTDSRLLEEKSWELSAVVGPGSMNNAKYSFNLEGWSVLDASAFMIFRRRFATAFQDDEIYGAVGDLEDILSSLFLNDRIPRTIFYFWYPRSLEKDLRTRLLFMLGQTRPAVEPDTRVLSQAFGQCGWIFNRTEDLHLDVVPSDHSIREWFNLLRANEALAGSLGLLQKAFSTINLMCGEYRHYDYLELAQAVILMVSGLESLFLSGSRDHADVSFKFRIVGTVYYSRYVTEDFLEKFGQDTNKLTPSEMMTLLEQLYHIRSSIAHGRSRSIFSGKEAKSWRKVFDVLGVQWREPNDKKMFFSHLLTALGFFQKHVFALIWCSKEHLNKGVRIVEELF